MFVYNWVYNLYLFLEFPYLMAKYLDFSSQLPSVNVFQQFRAISKYFTHAEDYINRICHW